MNADDVMNYGHGTLMASLDAVDENLLETGGACGYWSVKNLLAHLTSFEWLIVDTLAQITGESTTPHLDAMFAQGDDFNDAQVNERADKSYNQQLTEYLTAHAKATALLAEIPLEKRREKGLVAWYGEDYDLEDIIVYMIYAHKREHCGQIDIFKDSVKQTENLSLS